MDLAAPQEEEYGTFEQAEREICKHAMAHGYTKFSIKRPLCRVDSGCKGVKRVAGTYNSGNILDMRVSLSSIGIYIY